MTRVCVRSRCGFMTSNELEDNSFITFAPKISYQIYHFNYALRRLK